MTPFAIFASTKVLLDVKSVPIYFSSCVETKHAKETAFTFADQATIYAASFSAAQYALSISDTGLGRTEMLLGLVPGEQVVPLLYTGQVKAIANISFFTPGTLLHLLMSQII